MSTTNNISKGVIWTSTILQALVIAMFLMGAINNLLQTKMAVNDTVDLGYPEASVFYLGIFLLVATVLYTLPKTTFLGAILLTGWLGGAVATHVIHQDPMTNIIFPVIFGILVWFSIWLRKASFKSVLPFTKK
ncbi:MAG: hypothetical protein ACI9XP_000808 [Lentimonas sp.]|jgi:hypothetical protein